MGSSGSKKQKEEKEKKEQEAKKKCLESKAILEEKIKKTEEMANQKFKEAQNLKEEARKKLKKGDKEGARKCLAKKKKLEQLAETLNNQLMMMDDQLIALENAVNYGQIISTLKNTNNVLSQNKLSVEELEGESDKITKMKDKTHELNKVINDHINEGEDDEEIMDELEKYEKELTGEVDLPSANKEELKKDENNINIEDEINQLSV